jgi:hypothetical protein
MASSASAQNPPASAQNPPASAQNPPSRLTQLHDALHLAPTQDPAWRSYVAAVAANPQMQARRNATGSLLPTLPTPRRIALIEATMSQDIADFHRQGEAVIAFYNQLTPDQQAIFDRQTQAASSQSGQ